MDSNNRKNAMQSIAQIIQIKLLLLVTYEVQDNKLNVTCGNFNILKPGLHVGRDHEHKKPTCKPVRRRLKHIVLALVLMLASSRFTRTTQRRKHKHKHKRMEIVPYSCACAYACVVSVYTYGTSISTSARKGN